jgi:hypothetical protein
MNFPKISVGKQKVLVISPICDQMHVLEKLKKLGDQYIVVFTGEICFPWNDLEKVESRIKMIDLYIKEHSAFYILGDGDLTFKNKNKNNNNNLNEWIDNQCIAINILFNNNTSLTVVHGGIPLNLNSWNEMESNIELAFVRNIENQPWHKHYNGKFGYVISAHPTSDEVMIYDHSTSIDVKNKLVGQEYDDNGLKRTIFF